MPKSRTLVVAIVSAIALLAPSSASATLIPVDETFSGALNPDVTAVRWSGTGAVPTLSIIFTDADNSDGVADGAMLVDSQSTGGQFGASYSAGSFDAIGEELEFSAAWWNPNASFVWVNVRLQNTTDGVTLATSGDILRNGNDATPVLVDFTYTALAGDVGDNLEIRFVQQPAGTTSTARDFAVDRFSVNPDDVVVPEPSTALLASFGLLAMGLRRMRRRVE